MHTFPSARLAVPSRFVAVVLIAWALAGGFPTVGAAQAAHKSVLVLIGMRRDAPVSAALDETIRAVLNQGLDGRLDYHTEYLDVTRFPEPDYQLAVRDFLKRKYAHQSFDVVVATSDATADFVHKYRDEFCPGAAIVSDASSPRPGPNSTGVITALDLKSTIDVAMQLQPALQHVFVVSGMSHDDRQYEDQARAQFRVFEGSLDFTYASGMAMPDLLRRVADLPPDTIVFFLTFFEDVQANRYVAFEAFKQLAAAANVPLYHWTDIGMGFGMVGGSVRATEIRARAAANVALRVLKGESPASILVRTVDSNVTQFDWRQLQRWGISESRLPAGSIIKFRQPSLWDEYKFYVVGATSMLLMQTALIAGLLVQRVRRLRVESELRESEERFRVMADTAPVMVWRAGADRGFDFFNRPWLEFRGRTMEQELGSGWTAGVHSADLDVCLSTYTTAFDERRPFQMEFRLQRADGEYRWVIDSGVPRFTPAGSFTGYIGSCFDITVRREAEAELRGSEAALRASHEANQDLAGRLITAQEDERRRIARDLHDDINQRLALLSVEMELLGRGKSELDIGAGSGRLAARLRELSSDVHKLSHQLHPAKVEQLGLVTAARSWCGDLAEQSGLLVDFAADNVPTELPSSISLGLYRILQETLRNVVQHSHAAAVRVRLVVENDGLRMTITDEGRGFDLNEVKRSGLGLVSMQERMRLLRGTIAVYSSPGQGTRVEATVPLSPEPVPAG